MFTGKVIFPSYRCFEKSPFIHLSSQFHLPGVKRIRQIPLPIATVATSNSLLRPGRIWTPLEHCNKSLFPWGRTHDTINSSYSTQKPWSSIWSVHFGLQFILRSMTTRLPFHPCCTWEAVLCAGIFPNIARRRGGEMGHGEIAPAKSNVLMLLKARNAGLRYRGFCCSADVANNDADFDSCGGSPEQVGTLSMNIRAWYDGHFQ